jgi:hypothetical protein
MDKLRQWFQQLRNKFAHWLLGFTFRLLTKLSVEAINQFPWFEYGKRLNEITDKKFSVKVADQVQVAIVNGLYEFGKGLRT